MRYHSYLNTAKNIIENYKGEIPFAVFIKKYFSAKKKYGSKDRKQITALCYNYFRLGKALPQLPIEEKIIIAVFLCERDNNAFLQFHKPNWNEIINNPLEEKCIIANVNLTAVFPYADELSAGIDSHVFNKSFFYQPDLFLRIRPGKKNNTLNKIHEAGINFKLYADDCIALPNAVKVDTIVQVDIEVVVQDYNSQNVLDILKENKHKDGDLQVWDCCAASGGKSILA
ncbi:MAG TPA: Fmu (Sun) domain-containing protein, partial [Ferruginibacter sp.]|nr:Fmu (Sun) domain-containing protein [Ferruginibacter sp.]